MTKKIQILSLILLFTSIVYADETSQTTLSNGDVKTTTKFKGPNMNGQISVTQTKEQAEAFKKTGEELVNAIGECNSYSSSLPHPMVKGETIKYNVGGTTDDKCKFTQTMPNNGLMTCLLTEAQRRDIKMKGQPALNSLMADTKTCQLSGY